MDNFQPRQAGALVENFSLVGFGLTEQNQHYSSFTPCVVIHCEASVLEYKQMCAVAIEQESTQVRWKLPVKYNEIFITVQYCFRYQFLSRCRKL